MFTVDEDTQASTPGEVAVSKEKFLNYHDLKGLARKKYAFLLSLPLTVLHKRFSGDPVVYDFIQKTEQFRAGCLNPSIIINKAKGIIATYTDLTANGEVPTPVIKISKERLELVTNIKILTGQRLPSVSIYFGRPSESPDAWDDFDPRVVNCFTDDLIAYAWQMQRLAEEDWKMLEEGLSQINDLEALGLYYLNG